ncbi:MAG: type II secretion system protein [Okeania sp. SIO3B3]|nr:type II secretion system protein [Okeania sp. SIO3B3]
MFSSKRKQQIPKIPNFSESGYTIMEGLIAMIVVAVLMSATAPVIVLSVGNRVQARRFELGSFAGKNYIQGVLSGVIPAPIADSYEETVLDTGAAPLEITTNLTSCPIHDPDDETSEPYCDNPTAERGLFYCVDGDGDDVCTPDSFADMMVHAGIVVPTDATPEYTTKLVNPTVDSISKIGYRLYVKVYRANAFTDTDEISEELPSTGVNRIGLATKTTEGGNNIERPLFAIKTDIAPTNNSFSNWRDFTNR